MRPIDADRLKDYVITITQIALSHQGVTDGGAMSDAMAFCRTVDRQPTLDGFQQRHAHWMESPNYWDCSYCSGTVHLETKYCPYCGSIMDEEDGR